MSPPAGALRVVFGGSLPGGEIWTSGFWMTGTGVETAAEANAQAELMYGEFTSSDDSGALRITASNMWNADVSLNVVNTYLYPGGSNVASVVGQFIPTSPLVGTQSVKMPNQVCSVLTLRTGLSGRRHRGRMYLPCNAATLTGTGELPDAMLLSVTAAWALAFTDINASSAGKIVVVSSAASAATPVSAVSMDSRCDIQRRRANRQAIYNQELHAVTP